jgi:glycosyltransferase involved in cell wall biosynthesis
MKVLFINALFHPFSGGVEKHLLEISKFLAKRGIEVHVLTGRLKGTAAEETINGVFVHRIECTEFHFPGIYPPPMIIAPNAYNEVRKLDQRHHFDVIHLEDRWFTDFSIAASYAKTAGKPLVITLHNARTVGIAPHYTFVGGLFDIAVGRQVLAMADKIVSVSKWAISDLGKIGLSPKRFVYIPNGIDTREIKPGSAGDFKKRHGLGSGPMALFVGRLIKQKGLEYLLPAWKEVVRELPTARLVIVGRGNEEANLKKMAAKLGITGSVYFPGYIEESDLRGALHACDTFVLPSLWEVLPVAILEAMAAAKPIVCTDVGGDSELVTNGKNGFLVPKRDPHALAKALVKMFSDERMAKKMGAASRKRAVNEFDWRIVARHTHEFYKKLLHDFKREKKPEPFEMAAADVKELSVGLNESVRKRRSLARQFYAKYALRVRKALAFLRRRRK